MRACVTSVWSLFVEGRSRLLYPLPRRHAAVAVVVCVWLVYLFSRMCMRHRVLLRRAVVGCDRQAADQRRVHRHRRQLLGPRVRVRGAAQGCVHRNTLVNQSFDTPTLFHFPSVVPCVWGGVCGVICLPLESGTTFQTRCRQRLPRVDRSGSWQMSTPLTCLEHLTVWTPRRRWCAHCGVVMVL